MAKWWREFNEWMDKDLTSAVRAFAKWYFDLIKNAFVVVALLFAWKKTGNASVEVVATLTTVVFVAYTLSYPLEVHNTIRRHSRTRTPLLSLLITILSGIVVFGLVATISLAVIEVLSALFTAQGPGK